MDNIGNFSLTGPEVDLTNVRTNVFILLMIDLYCCDGTKIE